MQLNFFIFELLMNVGVSDQGLATDLRGGPLQLPPPPPLHTIEALMVVGDCPRTKHIPIFT